MLPTRNCDRTRTCRLEAALDACAVLDGLDERVIDRAGRHVERDLVRSIGRGGSGEGGGASEGEVGGQQTGRAWAGMRDLLSHRCVGWFCPHPHNSPRCPFSPAFQPGGQVWCQAWGRAWERAWGQPWGRVPVRWMSRAHRGLPRRWSTSSSCTWGVGEGAGGWGKGGCAFVSVCFMCVWCLLAACLLDAGVQFERPDASTTQPPNASLPCPSAPRRHPPRNGLPDLVLDPAARVEALAVRLGAAERRQLGDRRPLGRRLLDVAAARVDKGVEGVAGNGCGWVGGWLGWWVGAWVCLQCAFTCFASTTHRRAGAAPAGRRS
jgi:hypothetical protein